jgi:cytochrome c553
MTCASISAQIPAASEVEFFEKSIRPVLAANCYRCHGEDPEKLKSGLNLTFREGMLTGGARGPALVAGQAENSLILEAIGYGNDDLQMPPDGKLSDEAIGNIRKWIAMGAPDPRDEPFVAGSGDDDVTWPAIRDERSKWWSFQPIEKPPLPDVTAAEWAGHPVDRFIAAKLDEAGLAPVPVADSHALVRRLFYVLTGLPPTPEETRQFVAAAKVDRQSAVEATVDRLLGSVRFGERWARHWMDWMRYADSHGSEVDPAIVNAWRYRDYLIRALNSDVPYDQLVREHLAGDLLPEPRINEELEINESILGTAQYRMVLHGYSPTDALDEQARFTENQIDVLSKGFLATTLACTRCHNHKFDPVSQKDFYALYGIMASSRPATRVIDTPERLNTNKAALASLKPRLREVMARAWQVASGTTAENLLRPDGPWKEAIEPSEEDDEKDKHYPEGVKFFYRTGRIWQSDRDPLTVWRQLHTLSGDAFNQEWSKLRSEWRESEDRIRERKTNEYFRRWDLRGEDANAWYGYGNGLTAKPSQAGEFNIRPAGDQIIGHILPAGMYSHTLSDKHSAVLASPRFPVDKTRVFVKMAGEGNAIARYVVQNYPRDGETYPFSPLQAGTWRWQEWDAAYWEGDQLYVEISTSFDQPSLNGAWVMRATDAKARSWFGISEVIIVEDGQTAPRDEWAEFIAPLFQGQDAPTNSAELAERYGETLRTCIAAWREGRMNDAQAQFLNYFVGEGLLPNSPESVPAAADLIAQYRRLEDDVPVPRRAPGVSEGDAFDQPLFVRGNHMQPDEPVARRFLEVIDETPYRPADSGRLHLAESLIHPDNPLTARVIVNRLWHHVFGLGIVATPDDFGQMGEKPSHPELLDHLASRFVESDWSIKEMVRLLTTSRAFQLSATSSEEAMAIDPANRLLSHGSMRRLEAEAIRDGMLMSAGRMDLTTYGEPTEGTGNRRSVYVQVKRNNLDPFLSVFDAPMPTSTLGRRSVTNVPAQALTMLNDPFVIDLAKAFAARVRNENPNYTQDERIARMFELALGRPPSPHEMTGAETFLNNDFDDEIARRNVEWVRAEIAKRRGKIEALAAKLGRSDQEISERETARLERETAQLKSEMERLEQGAEARDAWQDLAQAIFSMKEFIFLM